MRQVQFQIDERDVDFEVVERVRDGNCLSHLRQKVFPQIDISRLCNRAHAARSAYRPSPGRTSGSARSFNSNHEWHCVVQPVDHRGRRKIPGSNDWECKGSRVSAKPKRLAEQAAGRVEVEGWNEKVETYKNGCATATARDGTKRTETQSGKGTQW